jgi:hypothetical protein
MSCSIEDSTFVSGLFRDFRYVEMPGVRHTVAPGMVPRGELLVVF